MNINFREKDWVSVKIINEINFHQGISYFIIQDQFGDKHLLNSSYYTDYKLEKGQEILCRIDKVNCKGKIFFEPKHPLYNEGEEYSFERKEINGKTVFLDIFKNHCVLLDEKKSHLSLLKVLRIKKGRCFIG